MCYGLDGRCLIPGKGKIFLVITAAIPQNEINLKSKGKSVAN
jgi:hypothetical protein